NLRRDRESGRPRGRPRASPGLTRSLLREVDAHAQPALRRILEGDGAAVAQRHVARDGEPQSDAAALRTTRGVEAEERPEYVLAPMRGNAGPVVVDQDIDAVLHRHRGDPDMAAVAQRIRDQI